jgi:hypothetical protein
MGRCDYLIAIKSIPKGEILISEMAQPDDSVLIVANGHLQQSGRQQVMIALVTIDVDTSFWYHLRVHNRTHFHPPNIWDTGGAKNPLHDSNATCTRNHFFLNDFYKYFPQPPI